MEKGLSPIIIKKRRGARHGQHNGSWKVALADFMTAMMAFFLLMWLLGGTTDEEKKRFPVILSTQQALMLWVKAGLI